MEDIIKIIIASFSSLWKVKKYGKTIEIITPFFTTNDCFVSVFLTEREGYYIITDGGWISENYYNNFFDSDDESYLRLFTYYKEQYSIRETESNNKIYYYKTTMKKELVPNLVLEVSNFISTVVSSSFIKFQDDKDKDLQKRFRTQVSNFLTAGQGYCITCPCESLPIFTKGQVIRMKNHPHYNQRQEGGGSHS